MHDPLLIERPPRIQPELPFDTIEIPKPPDAPQEGQGRLIQVGLPLVTIIGYVLISSLGAGRNLGLLIPMALSVVASTTFAFYSYRKEQQRRIEVERAYHERLVELTRDMEHAHDQQRRFYTYNYPDPATAVRIVQHSRAHAQRTDPQLRAEVRLWERRAGDADFGVIRLGVGSRPSTVVYTLENVEQFDNPQVLAASRLAEDSRVVDVVPITISLRVAPEPDAAETAEPASPRPPQPTTHALALAGAAEPVYELVRAILAHAVIFHAPDDLRLYVLATNRAEWEWAAHLPHAQPGEHGQSVLLIEKIAPAADDDDEGDDLDRYLEGLRRVLVQRKIRLQERDEETGAQSDPTMPLCLLVVDLLASGAQATDRLRSIETDAAVAILLAEGATLGATVIFLVPERSLAPSGCRAVIEVEETAPATNSKNIQGKQLHFRYAETGLNSFRYVGRADGIGDQRLPRRLAEELSRLIVRQGPGVNLPPAVSFMDLMGYAALPDLRDDAWKRWKRSISQDQANWLRVRLGVMAGNKPRTMVFSAKRDGVHGMVAGSTGSGKSELLISLITGMAVNYAPDALNFVLVDYKGGGAFKEFAALPHCVDIITNLGADGVTRMFTAIQAEMQKRQRLNADTGTKNIVEYRQKGLHLTRAPYPFLFIIIDEFAEMIADRAEYKSQLESITRVGRAQGVSLILAAQRPSGVTDQMRSNIKFRICLRVETPAESREMLRRVDAAFLPTGVPGRGYLQVGNEEVELIQVAYTGDPYVDPNRAPVAPVIWPGRGGAYDASQDQAPPEMYKAIIEQLADLSQKQGIPAQGAPWPGFLPTELSLSELLIAANPTQKAVTRARYLFDQDKITLGRPVEADLTLNPAINRWRTGGVGWIELPPTNLALHAEFWQQYALRPVVGLVDNPYAARQTPLTIDLPRGHTVLYGASGWGKSTFLRSLVTSLAAGHSPDFVHIYLLDLGGRDLAMLKNLPHVGAHISPDEESYEERVEQLIRQIDEIIDARKALLSGAGSADIYAYNQSHPDNPQPAIVVAIDNFAEFHTTFGGQSDDAESVLHRFITMMRQSRSYGVHVVITAGQPSELPSSMSGLFTERLTLRLADPGEYRGIVGGTVEEAGPIEIGPIIGRGYARIGSRPLAFQIALPIDLRRDDTAERANEAHEIEQLAQQMQSYLAASTRPYRMPVRVDGLPRAVLLKQLIARSYGLDLDAGYLQGLQKLTSRRWEASRTEAEADWLRAMIGVISGNRPRTLQLEAKADGVHGLIAGGTGAGKSELLMSLIVSLALSYDPSILNFVLVDYKGGGAFSPFAQLPHVVDSLTNLNRSAVKRVFTSIRAEMERRQQLNAETGTKDIIEYRRNGLHLGPNGRPYPHLFIIIDEYAEMIGDNPEFGAELDSITRLGRAQGVNLLLASQRPTGISDQMRANIKLRICLRVEQADTSREMLRRPDAAFLPSIPGRGYLQVGNEPIELIQVAYSGETAAYRVSGPDGQPQVFAAQEDGTPPRFFAVVVQLTRQLLGATPPPQAPWPPPLTAALTFADRLAVGRLDTSTLPLLTLGGRAPVSTLSPFVGRWMSARGSTWHGIDWRAQALRGIVGLIDNPSAAAQLPLIVDLARGHAVLFGASGWGKTTFLRSLAVNLASTHSPGELHIHVLDLGGRNLEALLALPHVGTWITPDEPGYEERIQQLWRELNETIARRKQLFSGIHSNLVEYNTSGAPPLPAVLVLIDNLAELIETFSITAAQKRDDSDSPLDAFITLARQGRAFGIHFAITTARPNQLASKLYNLFTERFTLRLADSGDYSAVVGSNVGEVDELAGRGYARVGRQPLTFQIALIPGTVDVQGKVSGEAAQIRAVGQRMHDQIRAGSYNFPPPLRIDALPNSISARELFARDFGVSPESSTFLSQIYPKVYDRWVINAGATTASWLQVTFATGSGSRDRTLRLEAKHDGVHGMVAGGTGSGKSELLMTLIVGLALNYDPRILNFVLVDYKGGGAFSPFSELPHVVDSVTNLNKAAVHRMFVAINAEIRRRQGLNAATGTKDIVEYRQKGLHLGPNGQPYPHLFIIIDEYAEMISDNPDYRAQLESITRVGRAQGVNLLLASQRPTGITDQMRANIKLRICLRVEQADTSRELLRRPDAAFLPSTPGRGYIQVGNEAIELIQVAYSGEIQLDPRPAPVQWPERPAPTAAEGEPPRLFNAVVALARELNAGQAVPRPWPGFLPEQFSLETVLDDGKGGAAPPLLPILADWLTGEADRLWPGVAWNTDAFCATVGLIDEADEARRIPLTLDLRRSHLAVFGDAGSGKTTLLRSLLLSLAATHSPNELHAFVLDMGGRTFATLAGLPHVGTVIYADEETFEERLQRLLDTLTQLVDARQRLIGDLGETSFYSFNARHPSQALPVVLVIIDNIPELQESYQGLVENQLIPLVRRSSGVGVSFAVSANVPSNLSGKLGNLFTERITFRQTNIDNYLDIVGRGAVELDDTPGRGYLRVGNRPLLFHAALPIGLPQIGAAALRPEAEDLALVAATMVDLRAARRLTDHRPDPIKELPTIAPLIGLIRKADQQRRPAQRVELLLGQRVDLEPLLIDLQRMAPHLAVVGPPLCGKTTALHSLILSLAARYTVEQVRLVLVDMQGRLFDYGGRYSLRDLPHVVATIGEAEQLPELTSRLEAEGKLLEAHKAGYELFVVIDNFEEFGDDLAGFNRDKLTDRLAGLARRYGRSGLHFIIAASPETAGANELKRRIMGANLGLGLRTAQAIDALKVLRVPAELRNRELSPGRGFLVKSGQPTMVQVASPYEGLPNQPASEEESARTGAALDSWVQQIVKRLGRPQHAWAQRTTVAATGSEADPQLHQMEQLVRAGAHKELALLRAGKLNGASDRPLISAQLIALEGRPNRDALLPILWELFLREQEAEGMGRDLAQELFKPDELGSILIYLEPKLLGGSAGD